jgi:tetratricopeptide (TPR) repeat protein
LADALNRLSAAGNAARTQDLFARVAVGSIVPAMSNRSGGDYISSSIGIIQRVAQGLAAAHAVGVVHGDIKPSNVLLSFAGEPMLMDFNLSAGPSGDFERAGGTPPYMAPECLADFWRQPSAGDETRPLDPRSDLFSIGVVLLELFVGRIPFQFDLSRPESLPTEKDWYGLVLEATAASREPNLQAALERCLAFDPAKRYSGAAELARDLSGILASKENVRRWTRRLTMAAAASAVIGTTVTLWAWNYEDPQSLPVLLRRAREHIERKEFEEALILLGQVQKERKDARLMAWSGYCLARIAHYEPAKSYFTAALQYEDRADLRNNLGYCCAKLDQTVEAEEQFARAIVLDPNLQAAFHNRANLGREEAGRTAELPLRLNTWSDYLQAAAVAPKNGELYLDTAKAIALAHVKNQTIEGDLKEQVLGALAAGVNSDSFRGSRFAHERLNLADLEREAKDRQSPPDPRSAPLILPPPFPLPER